MIGKKSVSAIILAAGNSTRFGKNKNKNFELLDNKPVLTFSIEAFDKNKYVDEIIIAAKKVEISIIKKILISLSLSKPVKLVLGGNTRKESVYNCLCSSDSDIVIIHDGARPLIKQEYINNCIENMSKYNGVTIGVKSKDTIKITNSEGIIIDTTNRDSTWLIQTPQCFNKQVLIKSHLKHQNDVVTDDCSLLEKDDFEVLIIQGDYSNIKITTTEDLNIVRELYKSIN